jgi:hypothetical protein
MRELAAKRVCEIAADGRRVSATEPRSSIAGLRTPPVRTGKPSLRSEPAQRMDQPLAGRSKWRGIGLCDDKWASTAASMDNASKTAVVKRFQYGALPYRLRARLPAAAVHAHHITRNPTLGYSEGLAEEGQVAAIFRCA